MKLPNGPAAIIPSSKLSDYLLNSSHPDNGGKAAFFLSLGFHSSQTKALASAFLQLASSAEVTEMMETAHGTKYIIDAPIDTPSGKSPRVRTIWIIDRGQLAPRLVTAYPADERKL